ncbi:retropepsin-like domain-containing protein [Candidatus Poribacteria bacterium]|nr:retropepsin-like domain-containing protein [Candidatus Poribacteria bacterium]
MGRTIEKVKIQNYGDILEAKKGLITEREIRTVEIEGIADTGATYLCLPPSVIEQLGLLYSHSRNVKTANGIVERRTFLGAYITIKDRYELMSVMENDHQTPVLIGYVVLEVLDFVVDPKSQKLIPNPASEGKWMADLYYVDYRRD